jgi:hypothetical protein
VLLEKRDIRPGSRELARGMQSGGTAADDDDVVHG